MPLWSWHPRVFLDVVHESEAMCPYCGTRYRLKAGTRACDRPDPATRMPVAPSRNRETPNLTADALGNTSLELLTLWLRKR